MPIIATLLAAAVAQAAPTPPAPPPPPGERREVRIMRDHGPGGPGDMDKDHDGFVSREEFTGPTTAAFSALDADHDNRISHDEMEAGRAMAHVILGGPGGPGAPGDVMMFHNRPDGMDGPGGPGRFEIRRMGPGGPDGPGAMDKDGDGRVTEAEFTAPLRDAFQRMDANHDGVLDEAERDSGHQEVRVIVRRDGGPEEH